MAITIGQRVRSLRASRGWSVARLARETQMTEGAIYKIEGNPQAKPTPETVAALADAGRQRQFLERLYSRIVVHREGLMFHHRLPGLPRRGLAYPRWRGGSRGWGPVDLTPWQP